MTKAGKVLLVILLLVPLGAESGSGLTQTTRWAAFGPIGGRIVGVTVDPQNPRTLYVTAGGIFKSTDGGSNWRRVYGPEVQVSSVLVDPKDPNNLYAETY